jgi:murein DD-endopeptidase MepM/ murein hydrolase activator NlpD
MLRSVGFFLAYAGLLVVGVSAYEGKLHLDFSVPSMRHSATPSLCGTDLENRLQYAWPVRPFDRQHPVRGNFGDPRTISEEAFGTDAADGPGDFSFHNGVDIAAPAGTWVYPVVSGWATVINGDAVRVVAGERVFQYRHITPALHGGQRVIAGRTRLGRVKSPANHVHLTEIDHWRVVNPLLHLRPYRDKTTPSVTSVSLKTVRGRAVSPYNVSSRIVVFADAADRQAMDVPGVWKGLPLAPALVEAKLVDSRGTLVWQRVVANFERTEPTQARFWQVYAPGTYQNFPVFDHHYYYGTPGRYRFRVTRAPLNTRRLPDGNYRLEVTAQDICGNHSTYDQPLQLRNGMLDARHEAADHTPPKSNADRS